jgi:hypothetical protein
MAAEQCVFFRDVKPYEIPDDLDTLQGPTGGEVVLSHSVLWSPGGGRVNLDRPGQRALAYRAALSEGPSPTSELYSTRRCSSRCGRISCSRGAYERCGKPGSLSCAGHQSVDRRLVAGRFGSDHAELPVRIAIHNQCQPAPPY